MNYQILVNKTHKLDEEYLKNTIIPQIIKVEPHKNNEIVYRTFGVDEKATFLEKKTADQFEKLRKFALENGIILGITSGYLSLKQQETKYNYFVRKNGLEFAKKSACLPGYSEHNTGLALDCDIFRNGKWAGIALDENGNIREGYDIAWDIISLEQPIHFEELCRRIAPAYGRQKATSVVRDEVKYIFRNHLKGMITEDKNEFVRVKDFADVKVRVPNPGDDYLRPINYICNEELALAMKTIAQYSFGITPDDLFIVTAREFGFKRTGENIIYSLRKVYQQMLKKGEVTEVDGKVHVN